MAERETLKDANHRIIGYVDKEWNGNKKLYDASFRYLGYYDNQSKTTKDANYRIVGYGDLLAGLLRLF